MFFSVKLHFSKALDCKKHAKTEPLKHTKSQEWFCNNDGNLKNVKKDIVLSVKRKRIVLSPIANTSDEQFCLQVCEKEVNYTEK